MKRRATLSRLRWTKAAVRARCPASSTICRLTTWLQASATAGPSGKMRLSARRPPTVRARGWASTPLLLIRPPSPGRPPKRSACPNSLAAPHTTTATSMTRTTSTMRTSASKRAPSSTRPTSIQPAPGMARKRSGRLLSRKTSSRTFTPSPLRRIGIS